MPIWPELDFQFLNLKSEISNLKSAREYSRICLARITHESASRDREDGRATGQPQGVESEAYLSSTSQVSSPEDAAPGRTIILAVAAADS
jgi:hypothetical protein